MSHLALGQTNPGRGRRERAVGTACGACFLPARESLTIFMLQFNSLDRPEDRPHCLKWIVAGNIFPGLLLILFFTYLFSTVGEEQKHADGQYTL